MSRATATDSTRGTRVAVAWLGGLAVVVLVIVLLVPANPPPHAITSTEPDGTDILRRVLADLDVEMVEGPADEVVGDLAAADVAVVFVDRLSDADEAALAEHRAGGGALVVADPRSALADPGGPGLEVVTGRGVSGRPGCALLPDSMDVALSVDGFGGIGPADVPDLVRVPADAATTCFRDGDSALVVAFAGPPGADDDTAGAAGGTTTVVADAAVLTNGAIMAQPQLGQLANLLVPDGSDGRVVVVVGDQPPPAGTGVPGAPPDRLVDALWLAGIALALFALARARRHGRVLAEDPPVEVPASELAVGIAELLQRHGEADSAAARVRADLRAEIGPRLGAGPSTGPAGPDLADAVVQATGLDRATVEAAVGNRPVGSPDELLGVTAAVRRVRSALTASDATPGSPP